MPGVLAIEVPCTTTCWVGIGLLAVLLLHAAINKHERKPIIPKSILRFKNIATISPTDLSRYTALTYAATIMIGVIKQRKKVVPKLGV